MVDGERPAGWSMANGQLDGRWRTASWASARLAIGCSWQAVASPGLSSDCADLRSRATPSTRRHLDFRKRAIRITAVECVHGAALTGGRGALPRQPRRAAFMVPG